MRKKWLCVLLAPFFGLAAIAQNYHAVHGSNYAGSLGIGNNPASIVNTPFPWDITVFSFQEKHSTNAVTVHNYSLLSSPANSQYQFTSGNYARYGFANYNINLLNARVAIGRDRGIGFGINLRGYGNIETGPYHFVDTITGIRDFFRLGNSAQRLRGQFTGSSWIEVFGSYGQTVWDRTASRLNAGITVKLSRGIAGAYTDLQNVRAQRMNHGSEQYFEFENATARYGYSSNFDRWQDEKNTSANLRDFLTATDAGLSIDLGVEYLVKPQQMVAWDEDNYYDYEWKIGVSLLDLGFNQYRYGMNSRAVSGVRPGISDTLLDEKASGVEDFAGFNDSLATVVGSMRRLGGKFNVVNPARLVINADRYLFDAFYVNADLSINLGPLGRNRMHVREINLLTITPRYETRRLGLFLPVMINNEGKMWIGGAFKLGPLLLGIHNWGNVFAKNKMQNGGGYLALVIRPGKTTGRERRLKQYECPPY